MSDIITGTCLLMCPERERRMREREGLLHKFEVDEKTGHLKRPKADPKKTIKCFGRPAAGQVMTDPAQLRPAPVLLATIRYLFTKILTRKDVDWIQAYDFTFDRLRSIRQDLVIQRLGITESIQILEPIVRFHIYAAQRLCERSISEYDPKINSQHLLECMKILLRLYDEKDKLVLEEHKELHQIMDGLTLQDNRPQMEALYILLNMEDTSALKRGLTLSSVLKNSMEVDLAMKIAFAWYLKNYVRVCHLIQKLPPLLICAALCNLRKIRRCTLKIMSFAYNNPVLTFPGLKLQELLLYKSIDNVRADCELFGLSFTNQNIMFQKSKFNDKALLANPETYYTLDILHDLLPQILLQN